MQNAVLEVKNLTKKFGSKASEFTAVDNVSFELSDGEILGLLGPNGAGKTTTIHMLLGVMEPTLGTITYFGKPFKKHREEILEDVNFSSTYISLPWHFTVLEILDIFAHLYGVKDRSQRIKKLLIEFEMEDLKDKQFSMLSAGERTRLVLTKAFLNYPKIILLDEPTASLDVEIAVKVREFLKKQKNEYNVSMLFTSHNMAEVDEMCGRIIIINHGKIVAQDSPENLAKQISECEIELSIIDDFQRAKTFFEKKEIPFEVDRYRFKLVIDEKNISPFLALLAKEKIGYHEISIEKPDLEDFFLSVIKEEK